MSTSSSASSASSPSSPQLPQLTQGSFVETGFGLLEIGQLLGQGTFGSVYAAQLQGVQESSAMKILPLKTHSERREAEAELRFLKAVSEAQGHVQHLVQFQAAFFHGNYICILMEKMSHSLSQHLELTRRQPLTVGQVMVIGAQMLTAVNFLHTIGIVHTDIKPANVLLADTSDLQIKVADFGNAYLSESLPEFTDMNCLQTLSYRAPEVLLGLELTEKIDVWSIGCVLAELYTGVKLFPATTDHQLVKFHYELFGLHESAGQGLLTNDYFKVVEGQIELLSEGDLTALGVPTYWDERELKLETIHDIVDYGQHYIEPTDEDAYFVEVLEALLNTDVTGRPDAHQSLQHRFFH